MAKEYCGDNGSNSLTADLARAEEEKACACRLASKAHTLGIPPDTWDVRAQAAQMPAPVRPPFQWVEPTMRAGHPEGARRQPTQRRAIQIPRGGSRSLKHGVRKGSPRNGYYSQSLRTRGVSPALDLGSYSCNQVLSCCGAQIPALPSGKY